VARRRMIWPEIWRSCQGWASEEVMIFICAITQADDQGKGKVRDIVWEIRDLVSNPMEPLKRLEAHGKTLVVYGESQEYYVITGWFDYQTIQKAQKSKIPNPPDWQNLIQKEHQFRYVSDLSSIIYDNSHSLLVPVQDQSSNGTVAPQRESGNGKVSVAPKRNETKRKEEKLNKTKEDNSDVQFKKPASRIRRPIHSGICGIKAFPRALTRSTRKGSPLTIRPTSGSTDHQPLSVNPLCCPLLKGPSPLRFGPWESATSSQPSLAACPLGNISWSSRSPNLVLG